MSVRLPILDSDSDPSAGPRSGPDASGDPGRTPPGAPDPIADGSVLTDSHGRVIRDVRLSITDRCNFRCTYCMDPDHRFMRKQALLSVPEYVDICRVLHDFGIRKLRITGGEPTIHPRFDELLEKIAAIGFTDIAITTNGSTMTEDAARRWRDAGVHRVTFSLDTLRPDRMAAITRSTTTLESVLGAIRIARDAGFAPVKVNAVVMRNVNDDECADFADLARDEAIDVRLIEWMPLDSGRTWRRTEVFPADEMIAAISARHDLTPLGRRDVHATSQDFSFADGAPGRIGIIASVTRPFCGACSRLRITADGKVRPCLFAHDEWDLRAVLRRDHDDTDARTHAIRKFLLDATYTKQAGHGIDTEAFAPPERGMSAIGG